ncbi:hypothetical protein TELCIR_20524, partial [Teladorsagia circumcincta]
MKGNTGSGYGNPLICDDDFDWFVRYLVTNRIRTFLPFQPEITCAGPEKYAGVRLKDLMMKKANETLTEGMKTLGFNSDQSQRSFLSALLPGFRSAPAGPAGGGAALEHAAAGLPILNTLSQAIPSMRNMPGLDMAAVAAGGAGSEPANPNLNTAIEQDYYTARLPPPPPNGREKIPAVSSSSTTSSPTINATITPSFVFSKELLDMLKMLPVGYNLSKIPAEIVTAFSRGEVPDLRQLPNDLIEHFKSNSEKLGLIFNRVAK